jgi:phosphoglycerate kinase
MAIRSIKDLELKEKRVLIRVDFNVPLDDESKITDDSRIKAAIPTIRYAVDEGARVIVMSHLGRPKGKIVKTMSLMPVARRLSELLGISVNMAPDCIGDDVEKMVESLKPSEVLLLENLRFHPEEEKNDPEFSKKLASFADCYVNDAFATAHRAHASNSGVCSYIKDVAAGFLMMDEVTYINKALKDPKRPFAAVIGGAKVSGKLEILVNLVDKVDKLIIGGGMAYTFLKAKGLSVGSSLVEEDLIETARSVMKKADEKGVKIYLPVDSVCATELKEGVDVSIKTAQEHPEGLMGLDIGPATQLLYCEAIDGSETIVWNGPMGVFEIDSFSNGTMKVADAIGVSKGLSIVGGGDTDSALQRSGNYSKVSFVSTAGGAFLEMLEGKVLPGVAVLDK